MDTNQSGVSLQYVADLISDDQPVDESGEQEAVEEVAQSDEPEAAEETQEEATDEGEDEEVEFEGKQYKVPKELKAALLRQSDYTQKTQAVAEQRKAIEEKAQLLQQREIAMSAQFEKAVEMRAIQDQLAKFKNIDWQSLVDTDPVQATKLNLAYQQLQQQAAEKYSELQKIKLAEQELAEKSRQQKLQEARADLSQRLPNFAKVDQKQLVETAHFYGYTDAELHAVSELNPDARALHVLHDAMQWRALQAKQPKAMQKVAEAPKVVKPAAKVTNKPINQAAADRIKSGKGSIRDLAAFL